MTGEHDDRDDRDDPQDFDDGEAFILEDWEELDQVLSEVEKVAGRHRDLPGVDDADHPLELDADEPETAEDMLFSTAPGTGRQPGREQFSETGASGWGGEALDPADIGIPTENVDRPGLAAHVEGPVSDEVHEVDLDLGDDAELPPEDPAWDASVGEMDAAGDGGDLALAPEYAPEGELDDSAEYAGEEQLEGFVPEVDPIYGAPAATSSAEPVYAPSMDDADETAESYAEYGESYVEAGRGWGTNAAPRRRAPLRLVAGLAALVLVGGGAATMVLKPEWLGMRATPALVDRMQVARPELDLTLAPPNALVAPAGPNPVGPPPIQPVDPGPELPTDVATLPTDVTPTPVPSDPPADVAQVPVADPTPDPGTGGVVVLDGTEPKVAPSASRSDLVAIGEDLQVGTRAPARDGGAFEAHPMAAGLVTGDQAFAQMHNGNFFVGNIKGLSAATVTLRVEKGEVTLPFAELRLLGTASSPEFADIQNSRPGFIRLTNNNRLVGNIVKSGETGRVALSIKSQQIVIPEEEIEEIGRGALKGVRVTEGEDDAWIRQLVEQRLEKNAAAGEERGRGERSEAEPPVPR